MELLFLREAEPPKVEGRTLVARVCTYDRIYDVAPGQRERVRRGAFKSPIARPSGLVRFRHIGERPGDTDDPNLIYGGVKILRDEGGALVAECELVEGERGDHLLRLVASSAIRGVSMSALVAESKVGRDGVREVSRVSVFNGLSLTPEPAYDDAGVVAMREATPAERAALEAARQANARVRDYLAGVVAH